MNGGSLFDVDEMVGDLRLAVAYASRAGLLKDRSVLDVLKAADAAMREPGQAGLDVYTLTKALNDTAAIISPMTVVDLKYGCDPFSPANQKRSRAWQLGLSAFALVMLLLVGYFMNALQIEQAAIVAFDQIQLMQPQLKLTALRKMAEYERPIRRDSPLYDQFHQKVVELRQVNSKVYTTYGAVTEAADLPLLPLGRLFRASLTSVPDFGTPSSSNGKGDRGGDLTSTAGDKMREPIPVTSAMNQLAVPAPSTGDFCAEESDGRVRLPPETTPLPEWMKDVLRDALQDFCFQLKVLSPGGDGALLHDVIGRLTSVPQIKHKIDLRLVWFLPFLFGLLGATLYMMRNVASVRTPAMELFPMLMRLSLGGVAGIVIGWFGAVGTPSTEIARTLSVPFALAFIAGYGIDVVFNLLDRLNRSIGDPPKTP